MAGVNAKRGEQNSKRVLLSKIDKMEYVNSISASHSNKSFSADLNEEESKKHLKEMEACVQESLKTATSNFLKRSFYKDLNLESLPERIGALSTFTTRVEEYLNGRDHHILLFSLQNEVNYFFGEFFKNSTSSQVSSECFGIVTSPVVHNSQEKLFQIWTDAVKCLYGKLKTLLSWYTFMQQLADFFDHSLERQKTLEKVQKVPNVSEGNTSAINALLSLFLPDFPTPPLDFKNMFGTAAEFENELRFFNDIIFKPVTTVNKVSNSVFIVGSRRIYFSSFINTAGELLPEVVPEINQRISLFVISEGPVVVDCDLTERPGSIANLFICCSQLRCDSEQKIVLTGECGNGIGGGGSGGNICVSTSIPLDCPLLTIASIGGNQALNRNSKYVDMLVTGFDKFCKAVFTKMQLDFPSHWKECMSVSASTSKLNLSSAEMVEGRAQIALAISAVILLAEMTERYATKRCYLRRISAVFCAFTDHDNDKVEAPNNDTPMLLLDQLTCASCLQNTEGECPLVELLNKRKGNSENFTKLSNFVNSYEQLSDGHLDCGGGEDDKGVEMMKMTYQQMRALCEVFCGEAFTKNVEKNLKLSLLPCSYVKRRKKSKRRRIEVKLPDIRDTPGCPGAIEVYPNASSVQYRSVREHGQSKNLNKIKQTISTPEQISTTNENVGNAKLCSENCTGNPEKIFNDHLAYQLKYLSGHFGAGTTQTILSILLRHEWALTRVFTVEHFIDEFINVTARERQEELHDFRQNLQTFQNAHVTRKEEDRILQALLDSVIHKSNALKNVELMTKPQEMEMIEIWVNMYKVFMEDSLFKQDIMLFSGSQLKVHSSFHKALDRAVQGMKKVTTDKGNKAVLDFLAICSLGKLFSLQSLADSSTGTISDLSNHIKYCHKITQNIRRCGAHACSKEQQRTKLSKSDDDRKEVTLKLLQTIVADMPGYFEEMEILRSEEQQKFLVTTLSNEQEKIPNSERKPKENPQFFQAETNKRLESFKLVVNEMLTKEVAMQRSCGDVDDEDVADMTLKLEGLNDFHSKICEMGVKQEETAHEKMKVSENQGYYPVQNSAFYKCGDPFMHVILKSAKNCWCLLEQKMAYYSVQSEEGPLQFFKTSKVLLGQVLVLTRMLKEYTAFFAKDTPLGGKLLFCCETALLELEMRAYQCKQLEVAESQEEDEEASTTRSQKKIVGGYFCNFEISNALSTKLNNIQLVTALEMMLFEYENVARKFLNAVFPLADFYISPVQSSYDFVDSVCSDKFSGIITDQDAVKVANECEKVLSHFKNVCEEKGKNLGEPWNATIFAGSMPLFEWKMDDKIKQLMAGNTAKLIADIDDVNFHSTRQVIMASKSLGLKFVCRDTSTNLEFLQKKLDKLLKKFVVEMEHGGTSVYELNGSRYRLLGESTKLLNGYVQTGIIEPPLGDQNEITDWCGSPFTEWTFTLKSTHGTRKERKYAEKKLRNWSTKKCSVDLQLVGYGRYLTNDSIERSGLDFEKVEKYYENNKFSNFS